MVRETNLFSSSVIFETRIKNSVLMAYIWTSFACCRLFLEELNRFKDETKDLFYFSSVHKKKVFFSAFVAYKGFQFQHVFAEKKKGICMHFFFI